VLEVVAGCLAEFRNELVAEIGAKVAEDIGQLRAEFKIKQAFDRANESLRLPNPLPLKRPGGTYDAAMKAVPSAPEHHRLHDLFAQSVLAADAKLAIFI
jgi:hypothetical protein